MMTAYKLTMVFHCPDCGVELTATLHGLDQSILAEPPDVPTQLPCALCGAASTYVSHAFGIDNDDADVQMAIEERGFP